MARRKTPPLTPFDLSLRMWETSWKSAEMMSAAGWTIGLRSLAMTEAGLGLGLRPHDAVETMRMVTEKMEASQEAALAMLEAAPFMTNTAESWVRTGAACLAPYHSRTMANAKRLGRKR